MQGTDETHKACDLIIFGSLGDLATKRLLPALYQLEKQQLLHPETRIIGVGREPYSSEHYSNFVCELLKKYADESFEDASWDNFQMRLYYAQLDLTEINDYHKLKELTDPTSRIPLSYCAISSNLLAQVSAGLAKANLTTDPARIVIEKPIGSDLASSITIDDQIGQYFNENQIFRIDHYLGKETVLNLLVLRFANSIFTTHWDFNTIDHVQISVAEEVGIQGRWDYYNSTGQLRDMVQNHLLQILTFIAMEPPLSLDAEHVRNEKVKVLKALRPITIDNIAEMAVFGQYTKGFVGNEVVPGYLDEAGAKASHTETFAALKVFIDNWRWSGVPFYLRTGKRMPKKYSEILISFKPQPHNIFYKTYKQLKANKLIIRLQPDEGVEIQIINKVPGLDESMQLQESKLDLSFDETFKCKRIVDAYERLLLEAMLGSQCLFVRRDEVEEAWKWIDGILEAWTLQNEPPKPYQAGTWGPTAATSLLAKDNRHWDE